MSSSQDYAAYVVERLKRYYDIRYRKMFGEYMIYIDDIEVLRQVVDALLPFIVLKPKRKKIKRTV